VAAVSAVAILGDTNWSAPPRFDGAGYAVLARAWLSGQGYRAIDHPDRPRHTHFPPGYPLLLALTWHLAGTSTMAAHVVSALCTVGAALAAWWWFRRLMAGPTALVLGLALAVNWLWARTGGAIQSEPFYLLLGQLTILAAARGGGPSKLGRGHSALIGMLLAACLLTRQVAIGLALAVLLDLTIQRRWRQALAVATTAAFLVAPWLAWMVWAGPAGRTQAGLLLQGDGAWAHRLARQLLFYMQRIPDQLTGPFVEVATVFQHATDLRGRVVTIAAHIWAVSVTLAIAMGWARTLGRPRRRLAGLIPLLSLSVLLLWPFTEAGRFLVPLIPCLLIGAVEGLTGLASWYVRVREAGPRLRQARLRLVASSLVLAVSLPYSVYLLYTGRARATEASHREFDAACDWLAAHGDRPGPVLSRHPGDVFWRTGRQGLEVATAERPGDVDANDATIARTIETYKVAYLMIDQEPYAYAPPSPLARYVAEHPERVRKVWGQEGKGASVVLYEVGSAEWIK
jgi:hypothetical protein